MLSIKVGSSCWLYLRFVTLARKYASHFNYKRNNTISILVNFQWRDFLAFTFEHEFSVLPSDVKKLTRLTIRNMVMYVWMQSMLSIQNIITTVVIVFISCFMCDTYGRCNSYIAVNIWLRVYVCCVSRIVLYLFSKLFCLTLVYKVIWTLFQL